MAATTSVTAASLVRGAWPWVRRIPSQAKRTTGEPVGLGSCAAWWASEMADSRRRNVETARRSAWSTR